jgi:hypothetical protein
MATARRGHEHVCFGTERPSADLGGKVELAGDAELCSAQKQCHTELDDDAPRGTMGCGDGIGNGKERATTARRRQGGCTTTMQRTGEGVDGGGVQRMLASSRTPLGPTAATSMM